MLIKMILLIFLILFVYLTIRCSNRQETRNRIELIKEKSLKPLSDEAKYYSYHADDAHIVFCLDKTTNQFAWTENDNVYYVDITEDMSVCYSYSIGPSGLYIPAKSHTSGTSVSLDNGFTVHNYTHTYTPEKPILTITDMRVVFERENSKPEDREEFVLRGYIYNRDITKIIHDRQAGKKTIGDTSITKINKILKEFCDLYSK